VRLLARAFLFGFGLCLAAPVGFVVFAVGGVFEPAMRDIVAGLGSVAFEAAFSALSPGGFGPAHELAAAVWTVAMTLFVMPPALVGVVGEVVGLRAPAWYGLGCGVVTAALPWLARAGTPAPASAALAAEGRITLLLFVTGAAAGLAYWLLAGRTAGISAPVPPAS
jgi:hypothetical protein